VVQAAAYLQTAAQTLWNWISQEKFTHADGLRRFGGNTRIHFPTLRERAVAGTLMGRSTPIVKPPKRAVAPSDRAPDRQHAIEALKRHLAGRRGLAMVSGPAPGSKRLWSLGSPIVETRAPFCLSSNRIFLSKGGK
jgi:hypothetical protein